MGITLNKMIEAALLDAENGAMEKIAQEAGGTCEKCGKPAPPDSKLCRECAEKASSKENDNVKEEEQEKTSSAHVEKLASAVDFLVQNFGNVSRPVGRVKMAEPAATKTPDDVGAGSGKNSVPTNLKTPTPGVMPSEFGEAKKTKIPKEPSLESGVVATAPANAIQTDAKETPGGANYPDTGVMKSGSRVQFMKAAMLRKAGADANNPANIQAKKTQSITGPENQPSQAVRPAEVTSQERLIASNEAAINATKRQAKEVPKKRMGELLKEPALSASSDSTLQKALGSDKVNQAGAKIASARGTLQKIASQGCTCETEKLDKGNCGHCKIASRIERRKVTQADEDLFLAFNTPGQTS
ncbi:MAG: hypothetical protein ACXAEU_17100 [Candidatus Hodarchaeales archaeon]|jgi:hypothetical protein